MTTPTTQARVEGTLDPVLDRACPCHNCPYEWDDSRRGKTNCPHRLHNGKGCGGRRAWEQMCEWIRSNEKGQVSQ
jgi:hypothetical protein